MLRRTVLPLLLVLAGVVFVPHSSADDPRSADMNDETVTRAEPRICLFRILVLPKDLSEEEIKKLLAPYRVVDIHEKKFGGQRMGVYYIRVSCLGDTRGLREKLLREDLPQNHPDRVNVEFHIIILKQFPENTRLGDVEK